MELLYEKKSALKGDKRLDIIRAILERGGYYPDDTIFKVTGCISSIKLNAYTATSIPRANPSRYINLLLQSKFGDL